MAAEQAALRRVAMLVARASAPEKVFAAVAEEVGRLLELEIIGISRFNPDGSATVVGSWTNGVRIEIPVGGRMEYGGYNVHTLVHDTGRAVRIDNYTEATGPSGESGHRSGVRSAVGTPIVVADRVWGLALAASLSRKAMPPDTETRLAGFTELVATALANAQAHVELRAFADEQAALRRVATLVARAAPPEEVFAAVTEEVGRVLAADVTIMGRYDPDGVATFLGSWTRTGPPRSFAPGSQVVLGGRNVLTLVHQTRRPMRLDYGDATGPAAELSRGLGIRVSVAVPISVADRVWGAMIASSTGDARLPLDAETRLASFTELVAAAISNAESQAALTASRARIVAAADATRRRIERDLHDGAQQRLVSIALRLRDGVGTRVPPDAHELRAELDEVAAELGDLVDELREIARGIHPAVLAEGGLRLALKALARRSAVPVELTVELDRRLPEPVELAAYYAVSEALTNTAKHSRASVAVVDVRVVPGSGVLHVRVSDDGCGGARVTPGSGLVGLTDRVEALGGHLTLHSQPGAGTTVAITLPVAAGGSAPPHHVHPPERRRPL